MSEKVVYLICFSEPYKRVQHYLGCTNNLDRRLSEHRSGNGARLLQVVNEAGITYAVVRVWNGYFEKELELKKRKQASHFCPKCNPPSEVIQ